MRNDVVLINRRSVVKNQLLFKELMDKEIIVKDTSEMIDGWMNQQNYIFRVSGIQSLSSFKGKIFEQK